MNCELAQSVFSFGVNGINVECVDKLKCEMHEQNIDQMAVILD